MCTKILLSLLCLLAASLLRAAMGTTASLEWLAVQTPLIVRGTVLEATDYTKEHLPGDQFRRLTLQVDEVLKGKYPDHTITVETKFDAHDAAEIGISEKGHAYLCFLRPDDPEHHEALFGCRFVNKEPVIIDLQHPRHVYLADMKYVEKSETLLAVVRKWVDWKPTVRAPGQQPDAADAFILPGDGSLRMSVMNEEIGKDLSCQDASLLQVPLCDDTRKLVLERSRRPDMLSGREGALLLRYFPGSETERQLYALLRSPITTSQGDALTGITCVSYPVRQAAYASLLALGKKAKKPEDVHPLSPGERQVEVRRWWTALAAQVLGNGWSCTGVSLVSTPDGWLRAAGGKGYAVHCANRTAGRDDGWNGGGHLQFTLYLMPMEWHGQQRDRTGANFHPATYLGSEGNYRVYCSGSGDADQVDPAKLARHFALKEM